MLEGQEGVLMRDVEASALHCVEWPFTLSLALRRVSYIYALLRHSCFLAVKSVSLVLLLKGHVL